MSTSNASPRHVPPLLWLAVVVLVTINLRPFLTASGPLGQAIQSATGMDLRTCRQCGALHPGKTAA